MATYFNWLNDLIRVAGAGSYAILPARDGIWANLPAARTAFLPDFNKHCEFVNRAHKAIFQFISGLAGSRPDSTVASTVIRRAPMRLGRRV
jgi:hypothetical protein